jgi:formylglycine-generating enzyme required for sulfatase activity
LPSNQSALFQAFVESLLVREKLAERDPRTREVILREGGKGLVEGLAALAWELQNRRIEQVGKAGGDAGVLTTLPMAEVKARLGSQGLKRAGDAGILDLGQDVRFAHQLLQEYFTAQGLRDRIEDRRLEAAKLWKNPWERSGWEMATRLLAGLYPDDCTPVLEWLGDAQPEVTADCIQDSGAHTPDPDALRAALKDRWLPRVTDPTREPEPRARAVLGRALGRLGLDDRNGVGCNPQTGLPDIDWIEIPAGDFLYGYEKEERWLDGFRISRYLITNAQFNAFVKAGVYDQERWWKGLAERIEQPNPPTWDEPNHPCETVSWYEVMAFCAWLSSRLGFTITLPTEEQWEKAARGTDGRTWPWVEEWREGMTNTDETGIGRTSPVGILPQGQSPYGVMDLAGNLWKWCLNEYLQPEKTQPGGDASRVLRGGSWSASRELARAVIRYMYLPNSRHNYLGFHVVCSSPIHSEH